ncbi:deoxyribose-phosphate aldolase [Echinimonas agarilytica]|uniref:Deoxyribose-phosphate aldolase n=1 Tax=Echinimonas agarilytica TaxID=1215918 RepID=A0AA42B774_9GAMM|nr:deoxyribose-phosphate aldolase [Echinimonas agarilytica]MCM2679555.1 deoxyribose-phosphate aldolase [Echinimonas agarilytica]
MSYSQSVARQAIALMDLTSLNDDDSEAVIAALCEKAHTSYGDTAAVCVYPQFVAFALKSLASLGLSHVKVATVTNFPSGSSDIQNAVEQTQLAVAAGAHEVDVVYPYHALLAGDRDVGLELVKQCKAACGQHAQLKVILETGALDNPELIRQASIDAIESGADFIKTSTGKVAVNATLSAARIMLTTIAELKPSVGFKPAGGIRTTEDAAQYIELASDILGPDYVTAARFRLGASSLLTHLLTTLGDNSAPKPKAGDY